jgi:hypothetical protein
LTPTSDNQSRDLPWSSSMDKHLSAFDYYTTAPFPSELHSSKKGRNKSLIRYHQAMVMPDDPAPKKQLYHFHQLIQQMNEPHSRKSLRPRRSLHGDERLDQRIFQLRVYDTDPSTLLQCSSRILHPPVIIKSDPVDSSDEEQTSKRRRALSDASESISSKKCKTDAAMAFDRVDIEESDHEFYAPEWIPSYHVFDQRPVRVVWKGKSNAGGVRPPSFHKIITPFFRLSSANWPHAILS